MDADLKIWLFCIVVAAIAAIVGVMGMGIIAMKVL